MFLVFKVMWALFYVECLNSGFFLKLGYINYA